MRYGRRFLLRLCFVGFCGLLVGAGVSWNVHRRSEVIFLGDSLTRSGWWDKLIAGSLITNQGINGDTTEKTLGRIGTIIQKKPEKIFIMVGINDLWQQIDTRVSLEYYRQMLVVLRAKLPKTKIFVQTLIPIHEELFSSRYQGTLSNEKIFSFNEKLTHLTREFDASLIDVCSFFLKHSQTKGLDPRHTTDGIHLSGEGYKLWSVILSQCLAGKCREGSQ